MLILVVTMTTTTRRRRRWAVNAGTCNLLMHLQVQASAAKTAVLEELRAEKQSATEMKQKQKERMRTTTQQRQLDAEERKVVTGSTTQC